MPLSWSSDIFRHRVFLLLLPLAVYLALVLLLGDWIMDDAGISYAYARNAAAGHGFVSQPGRPPVEGFSNFLWVLLLMPLFALGIFDPVIAVKALGAVLVLASLALLQRALLREFARPGPALLATLMVASAAPVVIWTVSGLENSLTLLLAVALFDRLARMRPGWEIHAGLLTALLAMTHPENALFFGAGLLVCLGALVRGGESLREVSRHSARYAVAFAALFVPFMAFRLLVFGLPFPHPYYAKRRSPSFWSQFVEVFGHPAEMRDKFADLARGMAGRLGMAVLLITVAAALYLLRRRALTRPLAVALAIQAVAVGSYLWMDRDWMGEYRFATVATVFSLVSFVIAGCSAGQLLLGPGGRRWITAAYLAAALVLLVDDVPRIARFAGNAPTPLADAETRYARKFDVYADILGLPRGSVLLPDIGAPLLHSRLTVYDAAGLTEPDVVRTLKGGTIYWRNEHPEFYDYVFETVRPTFISTHDFFTHVTAFERDPRFARDYVAINDYADDYVRSLFHWNAHSG
ncbi:MAG TPA: hypothetical protein VEL75_19955, partial [Candidatus Methylomirabilis sp.]|nr:hypothetical protein [Candidatus Methylomirabilis sp.]